MSGALVIEIVVALLVLIGAFFTLAGSIAMVRFPDFFLRLHGPTKATTLGAGGLLLAAAIDFGWRDGQVRLQEVLIMLFLLMTAPVSAHLLAKAALHLGVGCAIELPRKRQSAAGWSGAERRPAEAVPDQTDRSRTRAPDHVDGQSARRSRSAPPAQ